jgi:hypothetical protein
MVKALCTDILEHHLLKSNDCFTILEAALQAGVPSLADTALHVACMNFKHVLVYNNSSWATLSKDTVLLILCSDNLQVSLTTRAAYADMTYKAPCKVQAYCVSQQTCNSFGTANVWALAAIL